jgi:hypothetical protein
MRLSIIPALLALAIPSVGESQVTSLAPLSFGVVVAGLPKAVLPTDPDAARWRIHYSVLAVASGFQITLPTQLVRSGGGAGLPVSFCGTCGRYRLNNSNPGGATVFNPAQSVGLPLLLIGADVFIWLGATAEPIPEQQPGMYSATIVLTVFGVIL